MLFPSVAQISLAELNALQLLSGRRLSNKITQNQAGSSLRYPHIHRLPGKVALLPSILRVCPVGRVSEQPTPPAVWAHHRAQPRIWLPIINWGEGGGAKSTHNL